jgi:phosphate uptake regulator
MDKKINKFERDVRRKVMTHLAVGGKEDVGSGLVLVSVVIDIERIGDYTKNIYDLAVNHPKKLNGGSIEDRLIEVEKNSYALFHDSINAFKNQDIEKARALMGNYKENISSQSDSITNDIILGKIDGLSSGESTAIGLYARYLKRIAAHSRNLISSIVNPFERIGYPEK